MINNSKLFLLQTQWNAILDKMPPEQALLAIEREINRVRAEAMSGSEVFSTEQIIALQQMGLDYSTRAMQRSAVPEAIAQSGIQAATPIQDLATLLAARNASQISTTVSNPTREYTDAYLAQWQPTLRDSNLYVDNSAQSRERGWAVVTGIVVACAILIASATFAPSGGLNFFGSKVFTTPQNSSIPPPTKLERSARVGDKIGTFTVISGFGWRFHPIYKTRLFHNGVDVGIPYGIPYSMPGATGSEGYVKCWGGEGLNSTSAGGGYVATIASNDPRYENMKIVLMHLKPGSCIQGLHTAGDKIAQGGNSGISTGPHLHLSQKVNGKNVPPSLTPIREVLAQ